MASITRHRAGWRAQVSRAGQRRSKVFATKREAQDWAAQQEYLIRHAATIASSVPFSDVMRRYAREVSPGKRGVRFEQLRLEALAADPVGAIRLADLRPADLAAWRDRRLASVSAGTVIREMVLLSAVLSQARREWGLLDRNPLADVRRPPAPAPRTRLPTAADFEALALSAGDDLQHATARAFHAFRFGCATAMRAGEIVGLRWDRVDLDKRVAHLPRTKNGSARDVPLSSEAVALLQALPRLDPVFQLTTGQLDALWRKLRARAGVVGLTFHDSRAYAISTLARRVDVLTLARISGHRDIALLSRVYYRESAAEIAARLG